MWCNSSVMLHKEMHEWHSWCHDSESSLTKKTSLLNCKRRLAHKGIQTEVTWWKESEMGRLGTWTVGTRVQAVENKGTCYCIEILPRLLWWEYCKHATLAFGDAHITKTKSANFWRPLSSSKTKLPHPNVVTWVGTHMCTLRQNYTRILSELRSSSDQGSNPLEACSAEVQWTSYKYARPLQLLPCSVLVVLVN